MGIDHILFPDTSYSIFPEIILYFHGEYDLFLRSTYCIVRENMNRVDVLKLEFINRVRNYIPKGFWVE